MEVRTLLNILQELAPDFQIGSLINCGFRPESTKNITKIGVCIDPTEETIQNAVNREIDILISYHPWQGEAHNVVNVKKLPIISLHSAWDNVNDGVNFTFGKAVGLQELTLIEGVLVGTIELTFRELLERCQRILDLSVIPYYGDLRHSVLKVGISCGPGFLPHNKKIWELCLAQKCDTIISGELSLLPMRFAAIHRLKLVDASHSGMAKPSLIHLTSLLELRLKALDCSVEFFDMYYGCNFYTKSYYLQNLQPNDLDASLPQFTLSERRD